MFKLKNITNHSFNYSCSCGAVGKCMFLPVTDGDSIISELECPMCSNKEKLFLKKGKKNGDFCWALILENDLNTSS